MVLTCEGVLYSWETYRLERYISAAIANDRISGVVLFVNGPGGMITRVDVLEKLIRQSPKPIRGLYHGRMRFGAFLVRFRMRTQIRLLAHG